MKHAVVTGGASGLGLALAIRLHGDGWAVDLWDRDVQRHRNAHPEWRTERPMPLR